MERHSWKLVARDNGAIGWSGTIHLADRTHLTHWAWLYAWSRSKEGTCRVVSEDTFPKRVCVLPPRPPSPTRTNYRSVLHTDNIRTTRACQTRGTKNVKTRGIPLPACRSWGRTRNHDTRCVSKTDDIPPRVTTVVVNNMFHLSEPMM